MRALIEEAIAKFNEKVASDPKLAQEVEGVRRIVLIDLKTSKYHFVLEDRRIEGLEDGGIDNPDVTILTDEETLAGLFNRTIGPMKAYATGRLKFRATLDDVIRLRKFL